MKIKTESIIEPSEEILRIQSESLREVKAFLPESSVEVVGAMAVPMTGRPELDLLVVSDDIEGDSHILTEHGYKQGPFVDEASFLKKMVGDVEVAIQIMSPGNKMIETHRKIIALLRENEELRKQYEDFKRTLHGLTQEEYKEKKSGWIREHLQPYFE